MCLCVRSEESNRISGDNQPSSLSRRNAGGDSKECGINEDLTMVEVAEEPDDASPMMFRTSLQEEHEIGEEAEVPSVHLDTQ